jgi:hypothetical protein
MKNEKLKQKHYKFPISMQFKKCFFFCKTHLQLINMKCQAYEICHGKAQKINQPKRK